MAVLAKGVFGMTTRSATLLVVHLLGESHASEIAAITGKSLSRIQGALESLELAGLVVGSQEGRTRRVRLNPRFPALAELQVFLTKLGTLDVDLQQRLAIKRRRPRRVGKAI